VTTPPVFVVTHSKSQKAEPANQTVTAIMTSNAVLTSFRWVLSSILTASIARIFSQLIIPGIAYIPGGFLSAAAEMAGEFKPHRIQLIT
jgi:hypothetical protein